MSFLFGIGLSTLAISQGDPFWYDIINRFVRLRAAGKEDSGTPRKDLEQPAAQAGGGSKIPADEGDSQLSLSG